MTARLSGSVIGLGHVGSANGLDYLGSVIGLAYLSSVIEINHTVSPAGRPLGRRGSADTKNE